MEYVRFEVSQIYSLCPYLSHAWNLLCATVIFPLVQVKRKEHYTAQELLIFVLPWTDENNRSAMFILGCFQLSVCSLVSVSRGSVQECTGSVDSKAPAETPAKIPRAFL